ncbi:MAG: thiol reductant ABC exporter subunit CydD [Acidimicrobiales bacterium]
MTTPGRTARRVAGPLDGPVGGLGAEARAFQAVAVAGGLLQAATVVVQAVLLATVIRRVLERGAALGQVEGQLVGIGVAMIARGMAGWATEWAARRTADAVTGATRRRLLGHVLALGPAWLGGERAGELALSATSGTDVLGAYFGRYVPQLTLAVLAPAAVLVWVGITDWVSVLLLAALVAMVPPAMVIFGRRSAAATGRQWRQLSSLSAHLLELIQGLPTLRAFGRVDYGRREVAEATEGLRRSTLRTLRVAFLSSLSLELLAGLGTGVVAMVLGLRLLDGHTNLYVALAVLLVSPEVFLPLRRASAEFHAAAEGQAAGHRIASVLAVPTPTQPEGRRPLAGLDRAALALEEVTVEFPGRAGPVLGPLSLRVEPGTRVALVGPSGSGKSTALHALLGLVPLSAGRITVGSTDLAEVSLEEWRRHIAWVPQRPHLFAGSVAENLRLGDLEATETQLRAAMDIAGLIEPVDRLPRGLETPLGEGGTSLSSGERQRVAIARAVLHGGDLVLLDEIGAHLDPGALAELRTHLDGWLAGRTVIVASHHPDAVAGVDDVVVLGPALVGGP